MKVDKRAISRGIKSLIEKIILVILIVYFIFPIFWMYFNAFIGRHELFVYSKIFPYPTFKPTLDNFYTLFRGYDPLLAIKNSLIILLVTIPVTLIFSTLGAYALSRFRFRYRTGLALDILTLRIMPPICSAIPIYLLGQTLGLWGTYQIMILIYTAFNLPLGIWLMKTYIDDIPMEVEEAAMVDGASMLRILMNITAPLAIPGIISTSMLLGIFTWNEFLYANVLTAGETKTVTILAAMTIKLRYLTWGEACAGSILITVPLIILFILVEKYMLRAFTFGMMK